MRLVYTSLQEQYAVHTEMCDGVTARFMHRLSTAAKT
jgi:hypothetical protein